MEYAGDAHRKRTGSALEDRREDDLYLRPTRPDSLRSDPNKCPLSEAANPGLDQGAQLPATADEKISLRRG